MGRTNYHFTGLKKNIREQYTEHEPKKKVQHIKHCIVLMCKLINSRACTGYHLVCILK